MEASAEQVCPSCSAPTQARQRWCLECGAEVRSGRRAGLRSTVGIATTLAVLVGAGSAAGYTVLQDGKQPPPPATTVAQQAPPATTPPAAATQGATPYTPPAYTPAPYTPPAGTHSLTSASPTSTSGGAEDGTGTTTGTTGGVGTGTGNGSAQDTTPSAAPQTLTPHMTLTDVALGAVAVVYAPYAASDVDLGDASRVVDGTTRTSWKTLAAADPTTDPQVGIYIDLATREQIRKLVVHTPTAGMSIEVYGARKGPPTTIVDPGWDHLATRGNLPAEATIKLPEQSYRYILVWVTGLPPGGGQAAISELSLLSLQPE